MWPHFGNLKIETSFIQFNGNRSAVVILNPDNNEQRVIFDEESEFPINFEIDQFYRRIYFGARKIYVSDMMMDKSSIIPLLIDDLIDELEITQFVEFYVDHIEKRIYWIENMERVRSSDFRGRDLILHVRFF